MIRINTRRRQSQLDAPARQSAHLSDRGDRGAELTAMLAAIRRAVFSAAPLYHRFEFPIAWLRGVNSVSSLPCEVACRLAACAGVARDYRRFVVSRPDPE
jgi:hypothetical protein